MAPVVMAHLGSSALGSTLTWTAIIITLILLWIAFSQVGLLVLGWRAFSGQDLMPQKKQELPVN